MSITKGVFLSDIHMPENIPLKPVLDYIKDFKPDLIILGGDIIDAKGMHGVDQMPVASVDVQNYERDIKLLNNFIDTLLCNSYRSEIVYLEGNHEERYLRLARRYPKVFASTFDIPRDCLFKQRGITWIPYGNYESNYVLGDTIFVHGNIWPDLHAKAYATRYTPWKVVYGHLHHFQAYTTHKATLDMSPRYAVTAGCLTKLAPDWKKGEAHQWVNGFVSFISDHGVTVPTVHMIEKGIFNVGGKIYK